jgi:hypothetical protein
LGQLLLCGALAAANAEQERVAALSAQAAVVTGALQLDVDLRFAAEVTPLLEAFEQYQRQLQRRGRKRQLSYNGRPRSTPPPTILSALLQPSKKNTLVLTWSAPRPAGRRASRYEGLHVVCFFFVLLPLLTVGNPFPPIVTTNKGRANEQGARARGQD